MRRFVEHGALPPPDAVRIEEFINYFAYDDPPPIGDDPFSVSIDHADAPWTLGHSLLRIGAGAPAGEFIEGGNNRVILATDGDFNVGIADPVALEELITERASRGIFLTVLGFGMGNLKDDRLEMLADHGDGNYACIDSLFDAKKVLVEEIGGTLHTIAKDVKVQLELNPERVAGYRLIGYENRLLAPEDFNDDTKDAGEIGAGHWLTVLYEIVPNGMRFAASVAAFGMLLRRSPHAGLATFETVIELAEAGIGDDERGYRAAFVELVRSARALADPSSEPDPAAEDTSDSGATQDAPESAYP